MTRSSVAMRTPETIACFTRPQLSGMFVKLAQCDKIYESPALGHSVATDVEFGHLFLMCIKYDALQEVTCGLFRKISHCS